MRAMLLHGPEEKPSLQAGIVSDLTPAPGDVVVRVMAGGVTPTELGWYPTLHNRDGSPRQNAVPGHEFSGVVTALGSEVGSFHVGEAVYGMNDWFLEGATAEFCVADPSGLALKPDSLSFEEAATVPIAALTAWQGLLDRTRVAPGERVLVHGGAGSVGSFAIQIARMHGAHVITTAGEAAFEYVRGLGANECVNYRTERFEERVSPVDVVFDTVGRDTLERSWHLLKPKGRLVTIASDAEQSSDPRVKQAFFIVEARAAELRNIAALLDKRELQTSVKAVVPFAEANQAYTKAYPGFGKVVVRVGW